MEQIRLRELLDKYNAGKCTADEIALLESWYLDLHERDRQELSETALETAKNRLWAELAPMPAEVKPLWPRIAAAVSILLFFAIGGYYFLRQQKMQQVVQIQKHDIAPGNNKAILVLANGHQIILTGAKNGLLANQGSTKVNKTADGQLVYDAAQSESGQIIYNTMITPRGGQYHLVLADGTNVWLNASSSIKYPTTFTGKNREVEVTGEVYFEVAHNAAKPFRVTSNGQRVEVLGTHFNINAYADEPTIKTTLLQGSVRISKNNQSILLKPGEQAQSSGTGPIKIIGDADIEEAVAWKNGYFIFENENIHSIMRKLSRWYDIEPEYAPNVSTIGFGGTVSRSKNISEVLKLLELTQAVHFKIEGRRIKVMP